ncbi:MAG TPA: hypothetical protein VE262_13440 [Blastocatellia bacterium]|nr:hypothetical protein [Blastocatellia bacterium]
MSLNKRQATIISCLVALSLAVAHGSGNRAQLGESRSISLPSHAILDESAQPVITASGKTGFVSSITGGSLISFSATSGKLLSSMVVGETIGPITMLESGGQRLIAVPALNDPANGNPATVSIIDAGRPRDLELRSLLVLPQDALLTPSTHALLSEDGKLCFIAASFNEPSLLSFDVESGALVSRLPLLARPSEATLYDKGGVRRLAVASSVSNTLSLINVDGQGHLTLTESFSPGDARFEDSNNPAFSSDGRTVYIAASAGDKLMAVDSTSGALLGSAPVSSPRKITVASAGAEELIGVTRAGEKKGENAGGVTVLVNLGGQLAVRSQFTPPDGIEFSRSNNVVFGGDASVAFVASATGVLFAFDTVTGELESHQVIGSELRRIAVNEKSRTVMAIRSAPSGDEVVIVSFDQAASDGADEPGSGAPAIMALSPSVVQQSRPQNLRLIVEGTNFVQGSALVVEGEEIRAKLMRGGAVLEGTIRKALLTQPRDLSVQVKTPGGALSNSLPLRVDPLKPVIDKLKPGRIPGPSSAFTLRVLGKNFRPSSAIHVAGQQLNTKYAGVELQAVVPKSLADSVRVLKVRVRDMAVPSLESNEMDLTVFGPTIDELRTNQKDVVAGAGSFTLKILGENFRPGARVKINDQMVAPGNVLFFGGSLIKLRVPGRLSQVVGTLKVSVLNPGDIESNLKELSAVGPSIESVGPGAVLAGQKEMKVGIHGANFRPGARVKIKGPGGDEFQVSPRRIRFISNTRIVVKLGGKLNSLLAQPGDLKFQVINPNNSEGIPSEDHLLKVEGPEVTGALIKPAPGDEDRRRIVMEGKNFRDGAVVEFIKDGLVVRQQVPVRMTPEKLIITLPANKIVALGGPTRFQLRVTNPGDVLSNSVAPQVDDTPGGD